MNHLYYGDNLAVLRESVKDESVDLVYLDPPFNSNASYNVLFKAPSGEQSAAQIEAFEDTWHWNDSAERAFDEVVTGPHSDASIILRAMRSALGENDMMAYLAMMAVRLIELHRVLKPTGSLYLHCDPTASHYIKVMMDGIFGHENFQNEIIWKRTSAHSGAHRYGPVHDTILFYTAGENFTWNPQYGPYDQQYIDAFFTHADGGGRKWQRTDLTGPGVRHGDSGLAWRDYDPTKRGRHWQPPSYFYEKYTTATGDDLSKYPLIDRLEKLDAAGMIHWPKKAGGMPRGKRFLEDAPGIPLQDVWTDVRPIHNMAVERLGYPTQKPIALLDRIILSSTNKGDVVFDPFCGCGTTIYSAVKNERKWIGVDLTHLAIALIERRLKDAFPGIEYEVLGVPTDLAGARDLADRDKHEFQKWITAKIGAQPYKGGKKGMDRGIDGYLHFRDADRKPQFAIVSVKGGEHVTSSMIRDLKGTMEREQAALGLFITLNDATREMEREAAAAGLYETGGIKVPRLQILTAAQILDDRRPQVPFGFTEGFRKAAREETGQDRLL